MIVFQSLEIERVSWGDDKGKLKGKLRISSQAGDVTLKLNDSMADKLLQVAREAIIDSVEQTANDFIFQLTTAIPHTMKLEGGEA